MISKHYSNLADGRQTHYRRAGSGNPLIMLHASPLSSATMIPTMSELLDICDAIAPDTPGYGQSDPLPQEALQKHDDLTPYVEWLSEFIGALNLGKIGLYGSATGAQIAIEFARKYPEKLEYLILDNAAHFNDNEREEIISKYFPDISPQADGSHLQKCWNISESLMTWFPWYQQDEEHRISDSTPPLEFVHAITMAYLTAGSDYAQAYKRAFLNEDASRVQDIAVPVRVIRWAGSILKKYSDRYDDFAWQNNVQMCHCGSAPNERLTAIRKAVDEFSQNGV